MRRLVTGILIAAVVVAVMAATGRPARAGVTISIHLGRPRVMVRPVIVRPAPVVVRPATTVVTTTTTYSTAAYAAPVCYRVPSPTVVYTRPVMTTCMPPVVVYTAPAYTYVRPVPYHRAMYRYRYYDRPRHNDRRRHPRVAHHRPRSRRRH